MNGSRSASELYTLGKNYHQIRNMDKAKEYLSQAILKGSTSASGELFSLGSDFVSECRFTDGEECFQMLADRGHSGACIALGDISRLGMGREVDLDTAFSYYAEAYRLGNMEGALHAGILLARIGKKEIKEAAEGWLSLAAESGIPAACTELGKLYWSPEKGNNDANRRAFSWFMRGAGAGDRKAYRYVGDFYSSGIVVPHDDERAIEFYQKAAALGDAQADMRLGDMYSEGDPSVRDMKKAVEYYLQAYEEGEVEGKMCGEMAAYEEGKRLLDGDGVRRNRKKALYYLTAAAESGFIPACNELGRLYADAPSGPYSDRDKALKWFRKGMKAGDRTYAGANYIALSRDMGTSCMSHAAEESEKKEADPVRVKLLRKQAASYYLGAARAGSNDAWAELSSVYLMYGDEIGVSEADFLKAAAKGMKGKETDSAYVLWLYYCTDRDWNRKEAFHCDNAEKAFKTALEGAKRGNLFLMDITAQYYKKGIGTEKNESRARMWETRRRDVISGGK